MPNVFDNESAILVQVNFGCTDSSEIFAEFHELAVSAGATIVATVTAARSSPDPKYFIGSGKAEEIKALAELHHAELILFDHNLTPGQERNLEKLINCRILGRTGLILDIFAQRAKTFEGKLQVELAQLKHLSTRLVRGWTHLGRQKGGIGLRGPGETQLETDRRLIRVRIRKIKERLESVRKRRHQMRQKRSKYDIPTISIIGYTNAGKSTLFNVLTKNKVYVANQLFATLDPALSRIVLPHFGEAIIADTVGFIQNLPHDLVDAFRATLEETQNADLLVHVVDAHSEMRHDNVRAVNQVLQEIGANQVPQLLVFNKIDLMNERKVHVDRDAEGRPMRVWVSALNAEGLDLLREAMGACLALEEVYCSLRLSLTAGSLRSKLYELQAVICESSDENGDYLLELRLPRYKYERLFGV